MKNSKSLRLNVIANFIGVSYTTMISIVILPFFLHYLGAEAFGLIGFFTVFQAWMQLFDMGMSPMLSRQAAQARGQNIDFLELKKLLRSLELIALILALIIIVSVASSNTWIAYKWLKVTSLDLTNVSICIMLMGVMIGLRFFSSLYRSGIQGLENQVGLNAANIILVTIKFVGALLLLRFVTQNFVHFFIYQLAVAIVELMVLAILFYRLIPSTRKVRIKLFWGTLKPMLPFCGGIAYTAGIWILLTQLDKIILSNILPLSEYGYFTLVAVVSAGITQISGPISQAILPRMTYLLSQGKEEDMLVLYRKSTQFMMVIILPLTGMIALFPIELLFAWTGDRKAAEWAGPILSWFALGNAILAINAFQYYLQFAHGKLKMHVIYISISACIQLPVIIYTAIEYGALGVALVWFVLRAISFFIWIPIVHNKFAPGVHWLWLFKDVSPILLSTTMSLWLINSINIDFVKMSRIEIFFLLICLGGYSLTVNICVSSASRELIFTTLKKIKGR